MNEINLKSPIVSNAQYCVIQNSSKQYWNTNTVAFENLNTPNWHYYAIILTGSGVGNNYITANFPIQINTAGVYLISCYEQLGASPVSTDTLLVQGYYNYNGTPATESFNNWCSLANVKTILGITGTASDSLLSLLISQASIILSNNIKRNPLLCFYIEAQDGEGVSYLCSNNYPINNLYQITVNNFNSSAPTVYSGSNFVYNQEGTVRFSNQSYKYPASFLQGYQNWTVYYQGGYNVLPRDLQYACQLFVQYLYSYTQIPSLLIDKQVAKEVSIQYGRAMAGDFTCDVIFKPIEAILSRYRKIDAL